MSTSDSRTDAQQAARREIRTFLTRLDKHINKLWRLGGNIVAGWFPARDGNSIDVIVLPHYVLPELVKMSQEIALGARQMTISQMNRVEKAFGVTPISIPLAIPAPLLNGNSRPIESVIRRYGITKTAFRAAARIEIDGLENYGSIERVTVLNSLSYSLNIAQQRALQQEMRIDLARAHTGSGFIVWNRAEGVSADMDLYYIVALALAENAIARQKGTRKTAPALRAAFHIASHYEFFQPEGLSPRVNNLILGNVTEMLDRMITVSQPGQITIGHFTRPLADEPIKAGVMYNVVDTSRFLAKAQGRLDYLEALKLAGHKVTAIKNYLTGSELSPGAFDIKLYAFGAAPTETRLFNLKLNIYRGEADPLFIGKQDRDLADFGEQADSYDAGTLSPYVRAEETDPPENAPAETTPTGDPAAPPDAAPAA